MTKCAALPPCACRQGGSLLRVWVCKDEDEILKKQALFFLPEWGGIVRACFLENCRDGAENRRICLYCFCERFWILAHYGFLPRSPILHAPFVTIR